MAAVEKLNPPSTKKPKETYFSGTVGTLAAITKDGVALVDFPQNDGAPIPARCAVSESGCADVAALPVSVLLIFENGDPCRPIITGIIKDQFPGYREKEHNEKGPSQKEHSELEQIKSKLLHDVTSAQVDGKRVTIDAREEILLKCGKSSILLRKDGKIIIKGSNLISRSSMSNKIKGSSVSIN